MSELAGLRIVVTRPRRQAKSIQEKLRALGAHPLLFPAIEISIPENHLVLKRALEKLDCYAWMVLTSVNGVRAVWDCLEDMEGTILPENLKVAAIGPKTDQALLKRGVKTDFVPDEYVAEAIMPGLNDLEGKWVLLPRADLARPALSNMIEKAGGVAHEIAAYHTVPPQPRKEELRALKKGVDVLTFTSSSTVKNFIHLLNSVSLDPHNLPGDPIVACIGPITAQTARESGYEVSVVAEEYTIEGLLDALQNHFQEGRSS